MIRETADCFPIVTMEVPAVNTSNFGCALLSIRANVPNSVNCDGVAIVHHRSTDLWSANVTVKDSTFPSPQEPRSNVNARHIFSRSMGNKGEIVSVERIILNLPSGVIYKWQVLIAPRIKSASPGDKTNLSVRSESDAQYQHPLGKDTSCPSNQPRPRDTAQGTSHTCLSSKQTQASGVGVKSKERSQKPSESSLHNRQQYSQNNKRTSHIQQSGVQGNGDSVIRTQVYYKRATDVKNHNRFFSWLRRNFRDKIHAKKVPPKAQVFVKAEDPVTIPAEGKPPTERASIPISTNPMRPFSAVNLDYTNIENKHLASTVRWSASVAAALRYVTQCQHSNIQFSPHKNDILGKHQRVIAILADAGITTHERDKLLYLLNYGKEKLNLTDSILDCYFIKTSPVQYNKQQDISIYGVYCSEH